MATLRILAEDDVPAVVALFERVYPEHRWASQAACESYFREMLFDNPWRDPELPSWVAEEDGRIAGFQAVLPQRMLLRGRPIRVAVGCQFMVDPDRRHSLTALQLMKAWISGPQDLALADGASELSRRMWTGLGGAAPVLYNLHWTRPLRPARYVLWLLEERSAFSSFLMAMMLAHLPEVLNGNSLHPVYDARSLAWLLEQAARKTRHGALRARAVFNGKRRLIGWFLYYVNPGRMSEVVQIAARDGSFGRVLQRLLVDAWRHGATAVRGRLDPHFVQELSDRHCWLRTEGTWTLVHSRHADVMAAIQRGEAFLSRLEGEWWLRFLGG